MLVSDVWVGVGVEVDSVGVGVGVSLVSVGVGVGDSVLSVGVGVGDSSVAVGVGSGVSVVVGVGVGVTLGEQVGLGLWLSCAEAGAVRPNKHSAAMPSAMAALFIVLLYRPGAQCVPFHGYLPYFMTWTANARTWIAGGAYLALL